MQALVVDILNELIVSYQMVDKCPLLLVGGRCVWNRGSNDRCVSIWKRKA